MPTYSAVSEKPPRYLLMLALELPRLLLAEDLVEVVHGLVEHLVGLAGVDLVRTERVGDFVHHVAAVERVEDAEEEVEIHLQPGFGVGLAQAAGLLEQQHAEAVEPGVAQGQAVFGFIHAEAAGTAGAGGEEDVPVDDFLLAETLFFEALEVLDEVADGEIGRIALAVVAVFLAGLERLHVRGRHGLGAIAESFERAMHQLFVFPGETAEQQRGVRALLLGEGLFLRPFEMMDLALSEGRLRLRAAPVLPRVAAGSRPRRTSRSAPGWRTASLSVQTAECS